MRNSLVLVISIFTLAAICQAKPPSDEGKYPKVILKDAVSVFMLTEAQNRSLDVIIEKYPDLRQDATMARVEFNQAFGSAIKAVDEFLAQNTTPGFNWLNGEKKRLLAVLEQLDVSGITRQQAKDYLVTVDKRTKGDIPQRIYDVLVAFHPGYQKHPQNEMAKRIHKGV